MTYQSASCGRCGQSVSVTATACPKCGPFTGTRTTTSSVYTGGYSGSSYSSGSSRGYGGSSSGSFASSSSTGEISGSAWLGIMALLAGIALTIWFTAF